MNDQPSLTRLACPSCSDRMEAQPLARGVGGSVVLDLCFPCQGIWFDHDASTQLAPGAIIELFKSIHAHRDAPRRGIPQTMRCPRCSAGLAFTHDIARNNAITYYRCESCHGRFSCYMLLYTSDVREPPHDQHHATGSRLRCTSA